jgi:hypothetical protein
MKNSFKALLGLAILTIAFNAEPAHAQLVVFPDRVSFDTAFSGATVENWDEYNSGYYIANGATLNNITYNTNSTNFALVTSTYLTSTGSNGLGETGAGFFGASDTITFSFAQPLTAFAIDINTYTLNPVGDYTGTLSNGAVINSYLDPFNGYTTGEFIGVSDSTPFTSITIADPSGEGDTLDTLQYVNAPAAVVPEPATVALMIVGLLGAAGFSLRRKFALI